MMKNAIRVYNSIVENQKLARENKRSWVLFFIVLIGVFCMFASIHLNVFMSVRVSGPSMESTLINGDVLVINKCAKINRGDIIVFYKSQDVMYIKRVIGLPGDTVWSENGVVYVTFKDELGEHLVTLNEPYAKGETYFSYYQHEGVNYGSKDMPKVTVDEDRIFVLGDNREVSYDSRKLGCISQSAIVGKVTDFSLEHKDSFFKFLFAFV